MYLYIYGSMNIQYLSIYLNCAVTCILHFAKYCYAFNILPSIRKSKSSSPEPLPPGSAKAGALHNRDCFASNLLLNVSLWERVRQVIPRQFSQKSLLLLHAGVDLIKKKRGGGTARSVFRQYSIFFCPVIRKYGYREIKLQEQSRAQQKPDVSFDSGEGSEQRLESTTAARKRN